MENDLDHFIHKIFREATFGTLGDFTTSKAIEQDMSVSFIEHNVSKIMNENNIMRKRLVRDFTKMENNLGGKLKVSKFNAVNNSGSKFQKNFIDFIIRESNIS